jgi:SAM-dependent methyltransferase
MIDTSPQTWHYGLIARHWAEKNTNFEPEGPCYLRMIEAYGQPALDVGCGTGRLLIPLLQAGLEVDGCDVSADMLARCRERAESLGFAPNLNAQPNYELDLPRRYRTIYSCGVIGIGGNKAKTLQAMRRVYDHLRPGGAFIFDYEVRWNDPPAWLSRLPEERKKLPAQYPDSSGRETLADGSELELIARTEAIDPVEEVAIREMRARLWKDGKMIQEEYLIIQLEDYTKNELVLMLERAGFEEITLQGDYAGGPATADSKNLVFVARK